MENVQELKQERAKLFDDLYSGIIPKRIPIAVGMPTELCLQKAGLDLGRTQWTHEGFLEAVEDVIKYMKTDLYPGDAARFPLYLEILGAVSTRMSASGFIQHPEVTTMTPEDYDDFIKTPYDCIQEKIIPRLYPNLDTNPIRRAIVLSMAVKAATDARARHGAVSAKLGEKYGFYSVPAQYGSRSTAPLDLIADYPRGFKGIMQDIKRIPDKVAAACEAILPMAVHYATPAVKSHLGSAFMPGHMPTFLRTSEFEKLFYPSFSKLIHALAEKGQAFYVFCEDNWMRYLDYLYELPQGTRLLFEYGDPQLVKDKLGKKHIISGFYPLTYLKTATKQQCIDKAKELIDILAPGGNYYFNFDKSALTLDSINLENFYAVLEYVYENGAYQNAGQKVTDVPKESTIKPVLKDIPKFESKYYVHKEDYMKTHSYSREDLNSIVYDQVQQYEDFMFKTLMGWI
ncbi:uroporphyrinogen decarboxylase (URO-D) [Oxobacter pfennigii]|uniref:Uroporphyrinogen decarboxylase (URO-D) n=1 Tax=Oxobacter pfennigii TaxID=36849 RepID=A0A0P9AJT7_9CLOT|nr:uroporphyrinogen decarboxylase family protein [Oxobacter pfennigii]KPU45655.1 uroporphyrinogen decarboxylase (URO-D) [Oxobacter pfennigii]